MTIDVAVGSAVEDETVIAASEQVSGIAARIDIRRNEAMLTKFLKCRRANTPAC